MPLGKPRDPRKEQQWRRLIAQWQRSGLSAAAFCARHHLNTATFYAWRNTLQRRDAAATPFVPIHVLADPPPIHLLEVVLPDGRRVRVAPGFDPTTLRQLLTLLHEDPPC